MERSQLVEMSTATEGNGTSCSFRFLSKVVASLSSNAWAVEFEKNADLIERNSTEYSIDLSGLFVKILLAQSRIPPQHGKRRLCSRALERSRGVFCVWVHFPEGFFVSEMTCAEFKGIVFQLAGLLKLTQTDAPCYKPECSKKTIIRRKLQKCYSLEKITIYNMYFF